MLEYADQMGFDAVGVNEHHQNAYGMMPSPNLMAAALARRTSKAMILVLGNSIALYNPPTRVAEEMAMLDVISGGRLIAGFPVGTSMDINYCYGQNPATVRDKYREGHDLIIKAWQEREPFALNGKYTKLRYVNLWPQPIQKPHPPIWVPGLGSIETWDWCVDHGYNYSYLSFSGYKRAKKMMDGYWERRAHRGLDANPYSVAFFQQVCISDTDADCEREWWPHVDYFFNKCLHLYPGTSSAPGYMQRSVVARRRRRAGRQHHSEHGSGQELERARRRSVHRRGIPGDRAPAARGAGEVATRRAPAVRPAHRLGAERPDQPLDVSVRDRSPAGVALRVERVGRPLVAEGRNYSCSSCTVPAACRRGTVCCRCWRATSMSMRRSCPALENPRLDRCCSGTTHTRSS